MECCCEKVEKGECQWLRHPHLIDGKYVEDCKFNEYMDKKGELWEPDREYQIGYAHACGYMD